MVHKPSIKYYNNIKHTVNLGLIKEKAVAFTIFAQENYEMGVSDGKKNPDQCLSQTPIWIITSSNFSISRLGHIMPNTFNAREPQLFVFSNKI